MSGVMGGLEQWEEGRAFPPLEFPPLSRATLALYAGGSGDHNPLHIDSDYAKKNAGMSDVIGHGMLTMALLGRYVTGLAEQSRVRSFSVRFVNMTLVADCIVCKGRVVE